MCLQSGGNEEKLAPFGTYLLTGYPEVSYPSC